MSLMDMDEENMDEEDIMFGDEGIETLLVELATVLGGRYISRSNTYKKERRCVVEKLSNFTERQWVGILRMKQETFYKLVGMIKDHTVFQSNRRPQEKVEVQLAITLDRLAHDGSGLAPIRWADYWDRSEGACVMYFRRVQEAILSLANRYVSWPTPE
ncbi:hypothetical protein BGZ49_003837 [Haplosporangium sp. Z 27]|nr:hypothetical protein BGZ49_003837 [Haplosporangium sp. Z 27]